ncbi:MULTISPECIES: ABC transporter permease [Catenuloplanes]|uniref:ABC-2 type transport system permease protein n=1 Tax=Catenuloplanes niger TaxID=587534 RepID=A0AAE3ZNB5_9ACTN|nr:ABC transporter permease [Catenuloplanes niger]MDR7322052.1 ABC-2 type transport system permease protein [Catenuloplanes niger]
MRSLRMIAMGMLFHIKHVSRSPFDIAVFVVVPVVQATLAVYLFRASAEPQKLLQAAVGAGMMGVWSSVLFGAGGAISSQRWQGTLEMLMLAPRRPVMIFLPITLAQGAIGSYALLATLVWGRVLYGIRLDFARPWAFLVTAPVTVLSLGAFGILLASAFVLMRHANALQNALEYPVWLLSGMLLPISSLPAWTGPVAAALPTTWGARAMREATAGGPVWPSLGWCVAISALCLVLGAISLVHVERRARAAATLALA